MRVSHERNRLHHSERNWLHHPARQLAAPFRPSTLARPRHGHLPCLARKSWTSGPAHDGTSARCRYNQQPAAAAHVWNTRKIQAVRGKCTFHFFIIILPNLLARCPPPLLPGTFSVSHLRHALRSRCHHRPRASAACAPRVRLCFRHCTHVRRPHDQSVRQQWCAIVSAYSCTTLPLATHAGCVPLV